MGNILSLECIDGQAAVGKTTFILRHMKKQQKKDDPYCYLFCDPASETDRKEKKTFFFVKTDFEDPSEWPICPLDACQSGITHAFWIDLLLCVKKKIGLKNERKVLCDRSPLSHLVYEFWWKRLFPLITDEIRKDRSLLPEEGSSLVRKFVLGQSRGRDSLDHFKRMGGELMEEMSVLAAEMGVKWTIYLCFADSVNNALHNITNQRRVKRGGFDVFPDSPLEGDRTQWCELLYCPGECLLWETLWGVYQLKKSVFSCFKLFRAKQDTKGLMICREEADDYLCDLSCLFEEAH